MVGIPHLRHTCFCFYVHLLLSALTLVKAKREKFQPGFEPTTSCLPGGRTANWDAVTKAYIYFSNLTTTVFKWNDSKVEI